MIDVPSSLQGVKRFLAKEDTRRDVFIEYYADTWMRYFGYDNDFRALIDRYPERLCRQSLADIGKWVIDKQATVRQLFLAAMLWGFGTTGYGAYRTDAMLSTPDATEQIDTTFDLVAHGNIYRAYKALNLNKCGPSFKSKFLYAAGLALDSKPLPLVLDSVVANALHKLMSAAGIDHTEYLSLTWDSYGTSCSVQEYPAGYERYVALLNDWANQLGVRPDDIEFYLFSRE